MKKYARRPGNLPFCILVISVALFRPCGAICLPRDNTNFYILPSPSSDSSSSSAPSTSSATPAPPTNQQSPPQQTSPPQSKEQSPPPPTPNVNSSPTSSKPADQSETVSIPFSHIPQIPGLVPGVIKTTCQKLTHPELCMSSIQPIFPSRDEGGNVGLGTMLELSLSATKQQTLAASQELAKLAAKPETAKDEATMMNGCSERFNDAMDDIESAIKAAKESDIPTVQINLSAVLDAYSGCSDGDAPGDPQAAPNSPRAIYYKKLKMFVDNCFDLSGLLK